MSFKTESEYSYSQPVTIRAKMANGRERTGQLVQVENLTKGTAYQVILKNDRPDTCTCPQFQFRCKGSNRACRHIDGARAAVAQ